MTFYKNYLCFLVTLAPFCATLREGVREAVAFFVAFAFSEDFGRRSPFPPQGIPRYPFIPLAKAYTRLFALTECVAHKALGAVAYKILSACEPLTNSAVKDEQSDNDIILDPSVSGAPAVSEKPGAGEIIISLITQPGESRAFKISSSMLIDLLDGTVYLLNDTQVSTILRIIGHTE